MRKYTPIGPAVIIRIENGEIMSSGGIVIAAEGTRESSAREEATIIAVGEEAFEGLEVRPLVGDKVAIARYDGKVLEERRENGYEIRAIQDNRIFSKIEEV